jgi:hypothetical protein
MHPAVGATGLPATRDEPLCLPSGGFEDKPARLSETRRGGMAKDGAMRRRVASLLMTIAQALPSSDSINRNRLGVVDQNFLTRLQILVPVLSSKWYWRFSPPRWCPKHSCRR